MLPIHPPQSTTFLPLSLLYPSPTVLLVRQAWAGQSPTHRPVNVWRNSANIAWPHVCEKSPEFLISFFIFGSYLVLLRADSCWDSQDPPGCRDESWVGHMHNRCLSCPFLLYCFTISHMVFPAITEHGVVY